MSSAQYSRLPAQRTHRKVVAVLSQTEIDALDTNPEAHRLLNRDDLSIINESLDIDRADPLAQQLERSNLLQAGMVLVANPYDENDYAPMVEATDRFSLQRWSDVSYLCGLLGARSISIRVLEDTETGSITEFSADGGRGPISGKASVRHSSADTFASSLDWKDEFEGGGLDIERARMHMAQTGLGADPEIKSLVRAREFEGNRLSKRTLTVDLSRDAQRTIDAALSLSIPASLSVKAAFERTKKSRAHYKVTMDVVFTR